MPLFTRKLLRLLVPAGLFAACSGPIQNRESDLPKATTTGEAFEGVPCSAVRPPTEPDLMGWDPGSRANLNYLKSQGVVAVRYRAEGCNVELEVLSNCIGKGAYAYSPYSATDTKLARDAQELYAELPIGAARLGGKLKGGRALRTDYMLVGMNVLPAGSTYAATELTGSDCERATHVASKIYVGGFAMAAGEAKQIEAAASLFGAHAGGSQESKSERLAREGNAEACDRAQADGTEQKLCSVPLRLGLLAITGRADGSCPSGSTWNGKRCEPSPAVDPATKAPPRPPAADMVRVVGGQGVAPFWIDRTEVTVAAYALCANDGKCTPPQTMGHRFCNWGASSRGSKHPINCVDWNQAASFCAARGKRLPTEHEWETAASGGTQRPYPWGDAPPDKGGLGAPSSSKACWSVANGTCPVGAFAGGASPFGALDMAGNVWEWTATDDGNARVIRGGSWYDSAPEDLQVSRRDSVKVDAHSDFVGFRCAMADP